MRKILNELFNHERYLSISALLVTASLFWFYGCQPKVVSLQDPTRKVCREELQAEVDYFIANAEFRFKELDRQQAAIQALADQMAVISETGQINPLGILGIIGILSGTGATIDNVRKRKVIKGELDRYVTTNKENASGGP